MKYNDLFIEDNLAKPLSKLEINDYFKRYQNGELNLKNIIILHNIRYVISIVKHFSNCPFDEKDLLSVGFIGLHKSVDTFDLSKKNSFSTYAATCITNEILMFMRKEKKYLYGESLERTFFTAPDGSELKIIDTIPDTSFNMVENYEKIELYKAIHNIIKNLPEKERIVIQLYFGFIDDQSFTQEEIAERLNISQSYVSRLVIKVLKKIRFQLEEQKFIEHKEQIQPMKLKTKKYSTI